MGVVRGVVGPVVPVALGAAWRMDRAVTRRGSRVTHHSDVWTEVRENRRDADLVDPPAEDHSWTSWSRRNQR